jgi:hypothetical protein
VRILITGSRDWADERFLCNMLNAFRDQNPKRNDGGGHILVSGHCPDGADKIAEEYAEDVGWTVEPHPADWKTHGKRAGFIRNSEMVRLGADVCLAFIRPCKKQGCPDSAKGPHDSHGASMTVKLAEAAGIPTFVYRS